MIKTEWILCPVCGSKTRDRLREDTVLSKRYTEIKELTPAIVNEFVDYIMISKKQVINGKTVYPIDIYYNGIGIITTPTAEEYEEMFQERLKQKCAKK